jgi:hypothetical protein
MNPQLKNTLLALGSVVVIAASSAWIYYHEFKAPKHDVRLHQRVGEVMAEQTAKLIGSKGRLVLITIPTGNEPELKTQLEAFRSSLKKLGNYEIKDHELDTKDQPKYGLGAGLSGRRFVRTVKNNPNADAIVSFVGAPKLSKEELAELTKMPKFIAETKSPDHLPKLFEKQIIQVAVASRFTFPAPGPQSPKTPQEWFDKRYQIVLADSARAIMPSEGP